MNIKININRKLIVAEDFLELIFDKIILVIITLLGMLRWVHNLFLLTNIFWK